MRVASPENEIVMASEPNRQQAGDRRRDPDSAVHRTMSEVRRDLPASPVAEEAESAWWEDGDFEDDETE